MHLDITDPIFEREHAALFQKLANELQPVGELEILWCKQIASASLRNDVAAMKTATFALKKLQFLRGCKDDAAIQQALAEH